MDFSLSPRASDLQTRVRDFIAAEVEPIEADVHAGITERRESGGDSWTPDPRIAELQAKAREQGLLPTMAQCTARYDELRRQSRPFLDNGPAPRSRSRRGGTSMV